MLLLNFFVVVSTTIQIIYQYQNYLKTKRFGKIEILKRIPLGKNYHTMAVIALPPFRGIAIMTVGSKIGVVENIESVGGNV